VSAATTAAAGAMRANVQVDEKTTVSLDLVYGTTPAHVADFAAWVRRNNLTVVGYDVETGGLNVFADGLATLQFGNPLCPEPRAYVFCVRSLLAHGPDALDPVLAVLRDPKVMKLGQNTKFECRWTEHHLKTRLKNVACTQVAELVLRAGLVSSSEGGEDDGGGERKVYGEVSMAALCRRHLGVEIDKDHWVRTSFWATAPGALDYRQLCYAALDTVYPFYIAREQKVELTARALVGIVRIEWELIPILAHAELWGLPIDADRWTELWQVAVAEADRAKRALDDLLRPHSRQNELFDGARPTDENGKAINYASGPQVCRAIRRYCESIGWPIEIVDNARREAALKEEYAADHLKWRRETEPDFPAADAPDYLVPEDRYCIVVSKNKNVLKLAMLRNQLPRELVQALLTWSLYEKRATGFGNKFLVKNLHPDGTIKTEFHQALNTTGRISTTPNLQNIDKAPEYRACFRARPGYKFVQLDYSAQEPRITAQLTGDPTYLGTFLEDDDIYMRLYTTFTGEVMAEDDPRYKGTRQQFKAVILSKNYRAGKAKLRDQMTLYLEKQILAGHRAAPTIEEAAEIDATFKARCVDVVRFQEECFRLADPKTSPRKIWDKYVRGPVTFIESPCGRKRFFAHDAAGVWTEACNEPVQGCAATMTKVAAVLVEREIEAHGFDAHVVNLVHDEGLWEVRADQAEAFAAVAKAKMEEAGRYYLPDVPVVAAPPEGTTGVVDCWVKE
jgi:DNA polymerase I-like protein with 3'-5' exonuclease and polymerase domains